MTRQLPPTNFNDVHPDLLSHNVFKYSHGLTGTDQDGNWLVSDASLIAIWGVVLLVFCYRIAGKLLSFARQIITTSNPTKQQFWEHNISSWAAVLRKQLVDAPLFRQRLHREIVVSKGHIQLGTLASRPQAILVFIYTVLSLAWCLDLPWSSPVDANVAALRGRTGHLATFNLVFVILFALRNNPLIWILGVSFDTFNFLHRWLARILVIQVLIHVGCWFRNTFAAGGWDGISMSLEGSLSYRLGLAAAIAFLSIVVIAWSPIRRSAYGLFLAIHRPLALLAVIGTFFHLWYHDLPQLPWLYITITLLGLELLFRLYRIIRLSNTYAISKVTVTAMPGEASKLTLKLPRARRMFPGAHVRIYVPSLDLWGAHPFSVAWDGAHSQDDVSLSVALPKAARELRRASQDLANINWSRRSPLKLNCKNLSPPPSRNFGKPISSRSPPVSPSSPTPISSPRRALPRAPTIKARKNSLRSNVREDSRIRNVSSIAPVPLSLTPQWTSSASSTVTLASFNESNGTKEIVDSDTESVMSTTKSLASFAISLVIRCRNGFTRRLYEKASGSPNSTFTAWALVEGPYGVGHSLNSYGTVLLFAGGVGITHQLMYLRDLVTGHSKGTVSARRVELIWSVPSLKSLEWVRPWLNEIFAIEGAKDVAKVTLYCSRGVEDKAKLPEWVELKRKRCDAQVVVDEAVDSRVGAMAVAVCGPGALADGVRAAARSRMTDCSLDFFEEAFSY